MDGRYRYVRSKEDEIKLLKLEAEFYRSCNAVRQNGYELQQLKNYLVTELLELQKTKEKKIREYASYAQKTIGDLQVRIIWGLCFVLLPAASFFLMPPGKQREAGQGAAECQSSVYGRSNSKRIVHIWARGLI